MHCITLLVGPQGTPWTYLFRTEESARQVFDLILPVVTNGGIIGIADDFGQQGLVHSADFHGLQLENLDESKMAHVERALHNARTQAIAQNLAVNDPKLKTAAMMQGPSVFQPGGMNGRQ